jgi:hypothetical protein
MGAILGTCFLGVAVLASHLQAVRGENDPTGLALMAEHVYGSKGVLVLDHADRHVRHPDPRRQHRLRRLPAAVSAHRQRRLPAPPVRQPRRPAGVLQRRHLPRRRRQHADLVFDGDISALIPLYAFGVFTGFTLSQAGMVRHHFKLKRTEVAAALAINAIGAFTTGSSRSSSSCRSSPGRLDPRRALIPHDGVRAVLGGQALRPRQAGRGHPTPATSRRVSTHYVVVLVGKVNKRRARCGAVRYAA